MRANQKIGKQTANRKTGDRRRRKKRQDRQRLGKAKLPTHIDIYATEVGLAKDSVILLEQIRTLDKRRLKDKIGHVDEVTMQRINTAINISFGLSELA